MALGDWGSGLASALQFKPDTTILKMDLAQQQAANKAAQLQNEKVDTATKFVYDNSKLPEGIPPPLQDYVSQKYTQNLVDAHNAMKANPNNPVNASTRFCV